MGNIYLVSELSEERGKIYESQKAFLLREITGIQFNDLDNLTGVINSFSSSIIYGWLISDSLGNTIASGGVPFSKDEVDVYSNTVSLASKDSLWGAKRGSGNEEVVFYIKIKPSQNSLYIVLLILNLICVCLFLVLVFYRQMDKLQRKASKAKVNVQEKVLLLEELRLKNSSLSHSLNQERVGRNLFLADLCHEIRTPLSALYSLHELISDDNKAKEYGGIFEANKVLLENLLNDFSNITETNHMKAPSKAEWCDIKNVVYKALYICTADITKNYEVVLTASHGAAECLIDKSRIKQIVINIVSRALKYGGRFAHVHIETDANDGTLRLSVRDYGKKIEWGNSNSSSHLIESKGGYTGNGVSFYVATSICESIGAVLTCKEVMPKGNEIVLEVKCDVRYKDNSIQTNIKGNLALIAEKNSIGLVVSEAVSYVAGLDIFTDVNDFQQYVAKANPSYDIVLHHDLEDYDASILKSEITCSDLDLSKNKMLMEFKQGNLDSTILASEAVAKFIDSTLICKKPSYKVLVIDDNSTNYAPIRYMCTEANVHAVSNIADGLRYTSMNYYDCIFVDLLLEGGEMGYDFINKIKMKGHCPDSKIILYTASPVKSMIDLSRVLGSNGLMRKPIPSNLKLSELLDNDDSLQVNVDEVIIPDFLMRAHKNGCEDIDSLKKDMLSYLAREKEASRTVLDELFTYVLGLDNEFFKMYTLKRAMNYYIRS